MTRRRRWTDPAHSKGCRALAMFMACVVAWTQVSAVPVSLVRAEDAAAPAVEGAVEYDGAQTLESGLGTQGDLVATVVEEAAAQQGAEVSGESEGASASEPVDQATYD